MEIRDERADDKAAIRRVHLEAFGGGLEARLVDLLRGRGRAIISLVAVETGDVVGHVLLSPVTIDGVESARALGLAPVGVLPAKQRVGVGTALIRQGLSRSAQAGYDFVVLIGDPAYYTRFGFHAAKPYGLDNEYGVSEEFMVLELRERSLERVRGLVRYAPEFAEAEKP
jgi:putative acetyltransferase